MNLPKRKLTRLNGYDYSQNGAYHDHIIRGEKDYQKIWEYIDTNPLKWKSDCFYNSETEQ